MQILAEIDTEREVLEAWGEQDAAASGWCVGKNGCKRITVYNEPGQMGYVAYLKVEIDTGEVWHTPACYYAIKFVEEIGGGDE